MGSVGEKRRLGHAALWFVMEEAVASSKAVSSLP